MSKFVSSESEISLYSAVLSIRQVFNHGIPEHLIAFPCNLFYIVCHGHHLNEKQGLFIYLFIEIILIVAESTLERADDSESIILQQGPTSTTR